MNRLLFRIATIIFVFLLMTSGALAQARAPKGGTYVNGKFYKGGQFLPRGSGGMDFAPMDPAPLTFAPAIVGPTRAAKAARARARTVPPAITARARPSPAASVASGHLKVARNLLQVGKKEAATEWLQKATTAAPGSSAAIEAQTLLDGLNGTAKTDPAQQLLDLAKREEAAGRTDSAVKLYRQIVAFYPRSTAAKEAIAVLKSKGMPLK
jgi:hypothetical protein